MTTVVTSDMGFVITDNNGNDTAYPELRAIHFLDSRSIVCFGDLGNFVIAFPSDMWTRAYSIRPKTL